MKREIGYYWVKLKRVNSEWEVAFWAPSGWSLTGLQRGYIDRDFEKIDENRITRSDNFGDISGSMYD